MDTLEQKTAGVILQQPVEIKIGEKVYKAAPPSIATLILASAAISKLPQIRLDGENIASECLYIAKDCEVLGEIIAILMLGAKGLTATGTETVSRFFGLKKEKRKVIVDRKSELAREILAEVSPKQLSEILAKLLSGMNLSFFFATTTSLIEINLLKKTKEAETTASGR